MTYALIQILGPLIQPVRGQKVEPSRTSYTADYICLPSWVREDCLGTKKMSWNKYLTRLAHLMMKSDKLKTHYQGGCICYRRWISFFPVFRWKQLFSDCDSNVIVLCGWISCLKLIGQTPIQEHRGILSMMKVSGFFKSEQAFIISESLPFTYFWTFSDRTESHQLQMLEAW